MNKKTQHIAVVAIAAMIVIGIVAVVLAYYVNIMWWPTAAFAQQDAVHFSPVIKWCVAHVDLFVVVVFVLPLSLSLMFWIKRQPTR